MVVTDNALIFIPKDIWDKTSDSMKEALKVNPRVLLTAYKDYEPGEVVVIPPLLRRHIVETVIL